MPILSELLKQFPALSEIVLAANIIIAIFVAVGEYKRRKAQNKADEGEAVNSIAQAAAKVSESSVGLLLTKDIRIQELEKEREAFKLQIECYRDLLKINDVDDSVCED